MRGLDLESSRTLLDTLQRELRRLSNRAVALAHDAPSEHGDDLEYLASDIARQTAIVEVLQHREDTVL